MSTPERRTPTLTMCQGLPASGKTTWAQAQVAATGCKRVNKDDLRAMLDCGKWSREREKFILRIRDTIITSSLADGVDIICDDTNFAPQHKARFEELTQLMKAHLVVKSFLDVPVQECLRRDALRASAVGEKVILGMYKQYVLPAHPKPAPPAFDPALPTVILCDVDGTLTLGPHERGPFEWAKVGQDLPRQVVMDILHAHIRVHGYPAIVFLSGRDAVCRNETDAWIRHHLINRADITLLMRPAGDTRKDSIIKRELYEQHILGKYNVAYVLDDRTQVVDMWRSLGLTCLQVAPGDF